MSAHIDLRREDVAVFCRRHHIRKLALFGSVLRADFRTDSDVDMLVEFEADARVGLLALAGMEMELSELLGRTVELHTARSLHPGFREMVLRDAEVRYEHA